MQLAISHAVLDAPSVLILDDDVEALEEIKEILELDDIASLAVSNVSAAQKALLDHPSITAVVTDVHLSHDGETGVEFIAKMRSILADRPMTYIVQSGDPSAIVASIEKGAVDFLTKPLVPEDLLRAIRNEKKSDLSEVLLRKVEETTKSLQKATINLADAELSLSASDEAYQRRRVQGGKLRQGLRDGHIEPWFQPQVCMKTGDILGFEALVRWNDPVRGLQNPADFLPLAEEIGLIVELDEQVQTKAFDALKRFHRSGFRAVGVSVNLTPSQLRLPELVKSLQTRIMTAGLPAEYVSVEVLETTMLDDESSSLIATNLNGISELGVGVELDDFGTGYAGLSNLRDLNVSRIKIDRSFVKDIHENPKLQTFTRALISLAKTLGVDVLAEGVETREELAWLWAEGVDAVQGYYIAKPMPVSEALNWAHGQAKGPKLETPAA